MTDGSGNVFIVDDDPDIRSSLERSLRIRGYNVTSFASAYAFLDAFIPTAAACLILDQGMPDTTGLELQAHLKSRGIDIPIIFITGHGGVRESVQAMKGGAIDFLEKPFRQSELINCIENALRIARTNELSNQKATLLQEKFDRLTPREQEIANYMLERPSEVSSKEIARHLDISPRTVDNHRARILEKFDVGSVVELMHTLKTMRGLSGDERLA